MEKDVSERQRIEEQYHDKKTSDNFQYDLHYPELSEDYNYFWNIIGDVEGKKMLDFGCGNGWVSIKFATSGAKVWGFDISGELIAEANKAVSKKGLEDSIELEKMAAENLSYENDFFDIIVGSAILHHTELDDTLKHIKRVLKSDGRAIFIEPMNQNIFLRLWRKMTPGRRSPAERALTAHDLESIKSFFPNSKLSYFGFLSIFTEGLLIFLPRSKFLAVCNNMLAKFDNNLMKILPFLGKYSSVVVADLRK